MVTFKFQSVHSRNCNDWTMKRGRDGRLILAANGKGVMYRLGIIMNFLATHPESSGRKLIAFLRTKDPSYRASDLNAPLRQMVNAGMLENDGDRWNPVYSLTPKAKRIWLQATKTIGAKKRQQKAA